MGILSNHINDLITNIYEGPYSQEQLMTARADLVRHVSKQSQELANAKAALQAKLAELVKHQEELARVKRDLADANDTISFLSRNFDRNKKSNDLEIALAISQKLLPIIDNLRAIGGEQECQIEIDTLELYLKELMEPLKQSECFLELLSSTEMKIATMIKNGMTSSKIAKALFISEITVKTHRRNIRRKLGLKNSQANLKRVLCLKWVEADA